MPPVIRGFGPLAACHHAAVNIDSVKDRPRSQGIRFARGDVRERACAGTKESPRGLSLALGLGLDPHPGLGRDLQGPARDRTVFGVAVVENVERPGAVRVAVVEHGQGRPSAALGRGWRKFTIVGGVGGGPIFS